MHDFNLPIMWITIFDNVMMCILTTVDAPKKWNCVELFLGALVTLSLKLNRNGKHDKYFKIVFLITMMF